MLPLLVGGGVGVSVIALLGLAIRCYNKKPADPKADEAESVVSEELKLPASAAFPTMTPRPPAPTVGFASLWNLCSSDSSGPQDWPLLQAIEDRFRIL